MSLYRKYRPQKFSDLVGQEHVAKTLTNALKFGKIGHAYLFSGPRGTGKTTVARLLAKSLNCMVRNSAIRPQISDNKNPTSDFRLPTSEPCNQCQSCMNIMADKSLDVMEIDAASNRGIDEIRELREKIKFAPSQSAYKIYIIDEVHMLTKEAFNALLKTLEEPPKHAIFVMATTEVHKIPDTILSRVQQFDFRRARIEEIVTNLTSIAKAEKIKISSEALQLVAVYGDGSYRDSISIFDTIASMQLEKIELQNVQEVLGISNESIILEFLESILSNKQAKALKIIDALYQEGIDLFEFNNRLIEYLRKIIIFQATNELNNFQLTEEQKEKIRELSKRSERGKIINLIKQFIEASRDIKGSNLPQLPLEMVVMEACEENYEESIEDREEEKEKKIETKDKKNERKETANNLITNNPIANNSITHNQLNTATLKDKWPGFVKEMESLNRSLYLILKESEPKGIENGKFVLGVKYKIYAERICEKKNQPILKPIMEKVFGADYALECVVSPMAAKEDNERESTVSSDINTLLNDAMEVFG